MARILVTGAAGFIGGHLVPELQNHGHDVIAVDRIDGDLRDYHVAGWLIARNKPEIVIHLAAKVGRLFGEDDPLETIADNTGMTANVARVCGELGARLVYASTSEIYGDNGETEVDEEDGPFALPHNAYGVSKGHGEDFGNLYAPDGFTALRLSMPFGSGLPWGRGRAAIINMLWQGLTRQAIPVHKGAERSWCFVADTVRGIRMVIEQTDGGAYNIGRDDNAVSMMAVARLACDLTGATYDLIEEIDAPARQTVVKRLSTRRLRSLGWEPEVELEDGMAIVLEWIEAERIAQVAA